MADLDPQISNQALATNIPAHAEFTRPPSFEESQVNAEGKLDITYYKSPLGSCRYIFKSGKAANFVNHIYPTTDLTEILELDTEARHLGLTKATGIIDVEELTDPMVALKASIIREYLSKQAADTIRATGAGNDLGTSIQAPGVGAAHSGMGVDANAVMSASLTAAAQGAAAAFNPNASGKPVSAKVAAMLEAARTGS